MINKFKEEWLEPKLIEYIEQIKRQAKKQAITDFMKEIEDLITDEILICHKENTPTSRLTSLIMKLKAKKFN